MPNFHPSFIRMATQTTTLNEEVKIKKLCCLNLLLSTKNMLNHFIPSVSYPVISHNTDLCVPYLIRLVQLVAVCVQVASSQG